MTAGELREQFVVRLLEVSPGASNLAHQEAGRTLITLISGTLRARQHVVDVFELPEGIDPVEELARRLQDASTRVAPGVPLHFVAVGGPNNASERFAAAPLRAKWTLHHLALDGTLRAVKGGTLPEMTEAALKLREGHVDPATLQERRDAQMQEAVGFIRDVRAYRPPATIAIAIANALVFVIEVACTPEAGRALTSGDEYVMLRMGAWYAPLGFSEPWRVLTSGFLHFGLLHLALNMFALYVFGQILERVLGSARLLALYGASVLVSGLAAALFSSGISAGASGGVWGLMLAALALMLRPRGLVPAAAVPGLRRWAWRPVLPNLLLSFMPFISTSAHLGGGLAGFVLMYLPIVAPRAGARERTSRPWAVVAAIFVLLMTAAICLQLSRGRPWELRHPEPRRALSLGDGAGVIDITGSLKVERREDGAVVLGAFADPVEIAIKVDRRAENVEPQFDELAADVVKTEKAPGTPGLLVTEPSFQTIGERRTLVWRRKDMKGRVLDHYFFVSGTDVVFVSQLRDTPPGAYPAWDELGEQVVRSYRIQ